MFSLDGSLTSNFCNTNVKFTWFLFLCCRLQLPGYEDHCHRFTPWCILGVVWWAEIRVIGWPVEVCECIQKSLPPRKYQWCTILLVNNFARIHFPFLPPCKKELDPYECYVTAIVQCHLVLILTLKEVWSDYAILPYGTPHNHFALPNTMSPLYRIAFWSVL